MFVHFCKKFVLYCTLVSFTSSCVHAYIPELFDGADQGIEEMAKSKGLPAPRYLMPSERFMMMQGLKNSRFDGNLGPLNKALELPFNMQGLGATEVGIFPLDARSALLQCLFPCPDGVILLANQANSDLLSQITPTMMGKILRTVQEFTNTPDQSRDIQAFKLSVYSLLLGFETAPSSENFQTLCQENTAFLQHDFDMSVFRFLSSIAGELLEGALEEGMAEPKSMTTGSIWKAINEYVLSKGEKTLHARFKKHLGELPSFDELDALDDYQEAVETLKKLRNSKKLNEKDKVLQSTLQEKHKVRLSFEERRSQFRALGFVDALTRSIAEQENPQDGHFIYSPYMVEQTLMTYFWLKALNLEDVADFYGAFFKVESSQIKPLFSKTFDRNAYVVLKEKLKSGQMGEATPEILSAATRGFDMYENALPPLLQFKTAYYTPKNGRKSKLAGTSFPDCVETSIRNATFIHAQIKKGDFYESDIGLLKLTPDTNDALEQDPLLRFSQDAHNRWGSHLTEIPNVHYCKPGQQKELKDGRYELYVGWFNTLRVWAYLLGDRGQALLSVLDTPSAESDEEDAGVAPSSNTNDDDNDAANEETSQHSPEKLKKALSVLSTLLSRDDHNVEFDLDSDEPDWNSKFSDFTETVNVTINGIKTYIWEQDSSHSAIKYEPRALNDWRRNLPTPVLSTLGALAIPFVPTSSIEHVSDDLVSQRFWGMDFSNRDVLLELFEISTRKDSPTWHTIQRVTLKHLKELDDYSTLGLLALKVAEACDREVSPLTSQRLEAILRIYPALLESYLSLPTRPLGSANSSLLTYGYLSQLLKNRGYQNVRLLEQELTKKLSLQQSEQEMVQDLEKFKKLKVLTLMQWDRTWLLDILSKLSHQTLKVVNFFNPPSTSMEGIEMVQAFLARFPKLKVGMTVEGNENLKELETFLKDVEEKREDDFWTNGSWGY